jgi:cation-transporting ATPase 13A3/4/5
MLIMYGEILAIGGLIQYYFMVQMSQMMWVMIDGMTVPVSWALTMAQPAKRLSPHRPTARLLGFETILSISGQIIINCSLSVLMVYILFQQTFFVCKEFDSEFVDLRKWWELADNYEGAVTGILTAYQILHAACCFNIGSRYRQGFWKNKIFLTVYTVAFVVLAAVVLMDPNPLGCAFHINCGTKDALEAAGYNIWFKAPDVYYNSIGHNIIPVYFRYIIMIVSTLNLVLLMLWEGFVINGPVRKWAIGFARGRWVVKKAVLNL